MLRWLHLAAATLLLGSGVAQAQPNDVALVASGGRGAVAADAFASFVALPDERRYAEAPEPTPEGIALLVTIDTDAPLVRVWRRRDDAVLERRFDGPGEDGYALALVAAELLEVARTGADPESVGATVTLGEAEPAAPDPPEPAAPETASSEPPPPGARFAVTAGVGAEAWLSTEAGGPWLVQPALFLELVGAPPGERWVLGAGLHASGLGAFVHGANGVQGRYARYDVGLRLTFGGDVGPARTRLLGHLRGGGSAVIGSAAQDGGERRAEALRPGWFVGVAVEGRQPLVDGLELTLELGADVLPAPVTFTAFGEPLLVESPLRVGARLGLAWRWE